MAHPCARRSPLVRSGLTQDERSHAELGATWFVPDERELADLILFGQRFARHLQYYDDTNARAGDWAAFFEADITASLAAMSRLPVDAFRATQRDLEGWLRGNPRRGVDRLATHARLFFHLPLALLREVAIHHARLPVDHPLEGMVATLVAHDLAEPLRGLASWYRGATPEGLGASAIFDDDALTLNDYNKTGGSADTRLRLSSTVLPLLPDGAKLSTVAGLDGALRNVPTGSTPATWASFYVAAGADSSPYQDATPPNLRFHQLHDALTYNLLVSAVERIYQGIARIRRDASGQLQASVESFAGHAPHYGLWIAFLKLFRHAQGTLNEFTGRHLDFYFRDVLRLGQRPAVPDKVHVLFELAKGHEARRLAVGTRLRAGKDAKGAPVSYALDNDIVVNRASVAELRGVHFHAKRDGMVPLAASVLRSRDGAGELPLANDDPSWPPFGPSEGPEARIGFAVADRALFLREGTRVIILRAELRSPVTDDGIACPISARLTAEKGWLEVDRARTRTVLDNRVRDSEAVVEERPAREKERRGARERAAIRHVLEITITLDPDDAPIVPLDAKVHGTEHAPGVPVMEVMFDFTMPGSARAFAELRNIQVNRVTVQASASGVKNLTVVAGGAAVDPSKPFAPFGPQPGVGADFIVGSSEIFSKSIAALSLNVEWERPYRNKDSYLAVDAGVFRAHDAILTGGRWSVAKPRRAQPHSGVALRLDAKAATIEFQDVSEIGGRTAQSLANPPFTPGSVNGFARLRLLRDFGHSRYVREQARALVGLAGGAGWTPKGVNTDGATKPLPLEPYTPVITRLEAAYTTTRSTVEGLRHLHPFWTSAATADRRLLPDLPFAGALYVGVRDLRPPSRLTLLVQVADGSGDPRLQPPNLHFAFLAGDAWITFEPQDVDDKSMNFTGSGVLGLNVPERADTRNGLLPGGLHWFRISAPHDSSAFNRLLSIDAQAAHASFVDEGNDPAFLETPLVAGTITKLGSPDLAIKKVTQPYSSFDGRPVETTPAFARRVSERLRHKDRAVTIFDYEALVLEAFPRLYRVKCLSTTALERDVGKRVVADNERRPGAVTVITVPWTHGRNARNPLRPYADQATLLAVDAFLRRRVSPFVHLEVQNPKFEEVQVECGVKFRPEIGDIAFYLEALNQALVSYLAPWARADGGEITFGGKLWKSSIIDFIEEQPFVDYVTNVRMYHKVDVDAPDDAWTRIDVEWIEGTTARSILVSAPGHLVTEHHDNA